MVLSAKEEINWGKKGFELELSEKISLRRKYLNRDLKGEGEVVERIGGRGEIVNQKPPWLE